MTRFYTLKSIVVFFFVLFTSLVFALDSATISFAPSRGSIDVAVAVNRGLNDYGPVSEVNTPVPLTELMDTFCGKTLPNIDIEIYANNIPPATAYSFRVSDSVNEPQELETESNVFRMTDLSSYAYNTIYSIDVKFKIDETWSDYGPVCEVTTPAPSTQIGGFLCGTTLNASNMEIYADGVPLATAYRFRVKEGENEQIIEAEISSFWLNDVTFFAYNTAYTIDVAVEVDGAWSDYGPACEVTTPAPLTQIGGFLCGATLDNDNLNSEIYADQVPLATAYRFRVKEGENEQILESESEYFMLSDLTFFAYSTTYTIDVAVEVDGAWSDYGSVCEVTTPAPMTKVNESLCGTTLENIHSEIYADQVPLATAYRFRVRNGDNEQILETESEVFRMIHLTDYAYNTTYTVDVAVEVDGAWSDYGPACEISTPAPLTQIASEFCGTTLDRIDLEIYADQVPLATAYRFRVKAGDNEQILETESEVFRLSDLTFFAYSTTYTIDVAVEVDGAWSDYGPVCEVTTPAPMTKVNESLCGTTLENIHSEIYADQVPLATAYRFRVRNGDNEQILETESEVFRMIHLTDYAYNTTYTVDVAVEVDGAWSDYGTACEISTPAPLTQIASEFCGTTLDRMDSEIYADQVPLATAYRFRVKAGDNEQILETESEVFRLSDLPAYAYNTTYNIDIAVEVDGNWSDYGMACDITTPTASINADLASLTISGGTLSATFDPAVLSYTANVTNTETTLTVNPTTNYNGATVKINGALVTSGSPSESIALAVGSNIITIEVTAEDGLTVKTYVLTVIRAGSNDAGLSAITLSSGTLDPVFSAGTLNYTAYVSNTINSININPVNETGATIEVNGTLVTSGSASGSIPLTVGSNIITTTVTSQDGTATNSYSIKVIRISPDQILPDQSGDATVNNTAAQVVVISPTQPIAVTVPAGTTTSPSIAYGDLIMQGTGTIPQTIVNSSFARLAIPASTTVTASDPEWDGVLYTPTITSYDLPEIPGQIITTGLVIEVGHPDFSLSFDKAVRLQLTGQAGMRIARVHNNVYTEILLTGTEDSQAAGDALPAGGSFKINVGNDMVIWTKVFSKFIAFSQETDLNVALVEADMGWLTADLIKAANTTLSSVISSLFLPERGSFGSAITWASSNPSAISADGQSISRLLSGSGDRTVTLTATITKGLITKTKSFTLVVPELPNGAPTLAVVANQAVCSTTVPQVIALSGITGGPESGQTTSLGISSSNPSMFSELAVSGGMIHYRLNPGVSGTADITLTVKDNGGTANGGVDTFSRSFTLTVNPLPVFVISSDNGTEISKGFTVQLSVPPGSGMSYSWANASGIISGQNTPVLSVRPAVTTTYTLTITNSTGCVAVQSFTVNVLEDFKALDITNILTPNGDGTNDFLLIRNLDMYPVNTLRIFDRAGREIFTRTNYQNDWDGSFQGSPLAADTYYYIVDFGPGKRRLKGYVSIVR